MSLRDKSNVHGLHFQIYILLHYMAGVNYSFLQETKCEHIDN